MTPLALGAALVTALALTACGSTGTNPEQATAKSGPPAAKIRALQHISATSGWLLTDTELDWATGLSPRPRPITPADKKASEIATAYFLDDEHGWLASRAEPSKNGGDLTISRTADGGASWKSAQLAAAPGVSDVSSLDFVDPLHGFLLASVESSANFSFGVLYGTSDGGQTWTKLAETSGGAIRFVNTSLGFLAGGPQNDKLYMTSDGGQHWQERSVTMPADYPGVEPVYGLPRFSDSQTGVLPVTFSTASSPAVAFYGTTDGGSTWQLRAVRLVAGAIEPGVTLPTTVVDSNSWVVASPDGHRVFTTATGGGSWRAVAPNGLPSGVVEIDFATLANGWGRIASGSCADDKSTCTTITEGRFTTDGGQTWEVIGSS